MEAKKEGNNKTSDNDNTGDDVAGEVVEDEEILKRRISSHPLFGLLIETHLNCLKACLGETIGEGGTTDAANQPNIHKLKADIPSSSELDHFMEAYCIALSKLQEAMEEPLQESASFIEGMHIQLRQLTESHMMKSTNPKPDSPT